MTMNILLCNDDGIRAEGILAIYDALTDRDGAYGGPLARHVLPVAPYTVQSATGHGITFRQPLITKNVTVAERMKGIAVDGRPADCVKLGLAVLWPERFGKGTRPDLVVSGINIGANVGINVLYSGTCAAALEAAFLGVPSFALSLNIAEDNDRHGKAKPPRWDVAARHARAAMERVLDWHASVRPKGDKSMLAAHTCININVPVTNREGPTPQMVVCAMNVHGLVDSFEKNVNPLGETYYWSAGTPMAFHGSEPGKDVAEVVAGKITITALTYDLTNSGANAELAQGLSATGARRAGGKPKAKRAK